MQSLSCSHSEKYIFPLLIRRYYLFCGPLTCVGLLSFALFMFYVAWAPGSSTIPCYIVGILFTTLSIIFTVIWCFNYRLIRATYFVDGFAVHNQIGPHDITVPLCGAIYKSFGYSFNLGYASFEEEYTIISGNTLSKIDNGSIYKMARRIWKSGSVILPKEPTVR